MKPFFSIISVQTNSFSNESIAVGLIFVSDKIYFGFSQTKLHWLKKLNTGNELFFLVENSLKKIQSIVNQENESIHQKKLLNQIFTKDYFVYLDQYSAGAIKFSEPVAIDIQLNDVVFANYYLKIVGEAITPSPKKLKNIFLSSLNSLFKQKEVEDKADVNIQLHSNQFEGLLKNTKLSFITKNGAVNAIQSIDFTASISTIVSNLYEAQIINEGLEHFCDSKKVGFEKLKLAFELPDAHSEQKPLFDKFYKEKKDNFEFCELDEIEQFVSKVAKSDKYSKFSNLLV